MKNTFFTTLILLATLTASDVSALDNNRLNEQVLPATVMLANGCSGSIIFSQNQQNKDEKGIKTIVLTAKHCLDNPPDQIIVPFYNERGVMVRSTNYLVEVDDKSYKYDLGTLRVKDTETLFHTISLGDEDINPALGTEAVAVGFPAMAPYITITQGMTNGREEHAFPGNKIEYFKTSVPISGGNSGGPLVIKDVQGNYTQIGVASWKFRDHSQLGYFVPIDHIHDFLYVQAKDYYFDMTGKEELEEE